MNRRNLLRYSALSMLSFTMARDLFAHPETDLSTDGAGPIILRANENPHGPSPMARKAMMDAVNSSNRYQWDTNALLRERIGKLTGHTATHITLGSGSSELLGVVCLWASYKQGHVLASEPTFKLWMPASRKMGLATRLLPLTPSKHNNLALMLESINAQTKLVYLCNPNNPTGTAHGKEEMENFVRKAAQKAIVLLDEAYTDYDDTPSMSHLVNELPNLIIAKTFSKVYGMAGARVGYLLAQPDVIKQLNELQAWANAGPSAVSMKGALAAIDDLDFIAHCQKENKKARAIFSKGLEKLNIPFIPSVTSFVYFDGKAYPHKVPDYLQSHQILGARSFEENSSWLRLSIGTQQEMQRVVDVLEKGKA